MNTHESGPGDYYDRMDTKARGACERLEKARFDYADNPTQANYDALTKARSDYDAASYVGD